MAQRGCAAAGNGLLAGEGVAHRVRPMHGQVAAGSLEHFFYAHHVVGHAHMGPCAAI